MNTVDTAVGHERNHNDLFSDNIAELKWVGMDKTRRFNDFVIAR
jgi:hypothetical protein